MHDIVNNLPQLTADNLKVIAGIITTSTFISILLQTAQHKFDWHNNRRKLYALASLLSVLGSLADWFISDSHLNATHYTGKYGAWILSTSVAIHLFLASPIAQWFVNKYKTYQIGKAVQVPAVAVTEVLPAEVAPMEGELDTEDEENPFK